MPHIDPLREFSESVAKSLNLSTSEVDSEAVTQIVIEHYNLWYKSGKEPGYIDMCVEAIYETI